jgi:DNA-binding transcriptional LysR family regulator
VLTIVLRGRSAWVHPISALECALAYYVVCRAQDSDDPTIVAFRNWLLQEAAREIDPKDLT